MSHYRDATEVDLDNPEYRAAEGNVA